MIIGNGDLATALRSSDREDLIFFCSGVSNSQETRESEFRREKELLFEQELDKRLVYFSTLSTLYLDTPYTRHKQRMEMYVQMWNKHTIVRLGNISFGSNEHTLINHLKGQVARGEKLDIQDVFRYVVDKDEFLYWISLIPNFNYSMNIPGRRMKVADIVKEYVYGHTTKDTGKV